MTPRYRVQGDSFVIDNYNAAFTFSSFFPALAGEDGKPTWLFYANRGQAVASFGINNKDGAILEFMPANKAYQALPLLGFRTFIQAAGKTDGWYEPFSIKGISHQQMVIRPYELELQDQHDNGLHSTVVYFGVPHEAHPVLARCLTIKNTSAKPVTLSVVDGLPRLLPYGMNDFLAKNMARTIEAFAEVLNVSLHVPFFKLKVEPTDRPEFNPLRSGFFSFGLSNRSMSQVIVDPSIVFGEDTSFFAPSSVFSAARPLNRAQLTSNIMPSSFFFARAVLPPKSSRSFYSYYGFARRPEDSLDLATRILGRADYFDKKRAEMRAVYEGLVQRLGVKTGDNDFNNYCNVSFMDNVLRGGYPQSFGPNGPIIHLYSRKHGDMERDYNAFQVSATYYSQGNGNFRDVNQNRRHDLYLNPDVGVANVEFFFNLLQLDGYNPLIINPTKFLVPKDLIARSELNVNESCKTEFKNLVAGPVLAGQLYEFIKRNSKDLLNVSSLFKEIIRQCLPQYTVQHGEGYWIDHWTYNLDHLDQYLSVYPEQKQWLLFEKNDFTYFDSDHFVRPRKDKYIITPEGGLRQYGAVVSSAQKQELLASRTREPHKVRTEKGQGEIFATNLFVKLLALSLVKVSTLDPGGVGLEMEADKPGWCDALNGLPGLFGSSTHEMWELHRLVRFLIKEALPQAPHKSLELPAEIFTLLRNVEEALDSATSRDFRPVWDKLASAREVFREEVFLGVSGKTKPVRIAEINRFLEKASAVLTTAEEKAMDPKTKLPTSYFTYDVAAARLDGGWRQELQKLEWEQHRLQPFLEGAVHALKLCVPLKAAKIYKAVRESELNDRKVRMYRLNTSLQSESFEIGRIKVFSPGWLENESIFLHMHYKFLLELLRSGLVKEFYEEVRRGVIAYLDPAVYGRSIFENSSFIASSSFPNEQYHGKGFVARLSGATSELLSMIYFAS